MVVSALPPAVPSNNKGILETLPLEIWLRVLDLLRWDSGKTLQSLNSTCREFNQIVSPRLFRTLRINRPQSDAAAYQKLVARLGQDVGEGIYPHVRVLILSRIVPRARGHKDVEPKFILALLAKLHNIEIIRWNGTPLPPLFFQTLNAKNIAPVVYYTGPSVGLIEIGLKCTHIRSLSITWYCISKRQPDINDQGKVIVSLPYLERLVLKHYPGRVGGIRPIFDMPPGSMLPPLRVLSITNFSFNSDQAAGWARCIKDRNIKDLSLDGDSELLSKLIRDLTGCVPNLQSFTVRIADGTAPFVNLRVIEMLDGFLQQIKELRAFSSYDVPKEVLRSAVHYHGSNLRQLRFRSTGWSYLQVPRRVHSRLWMPESVEACCQFSPNELRDLCSQIPFVERLGLDICFPEKVPCELLEPFGYFARLKYLELNSPLREQMNPCPWGEIFYLRPLGYRDWMDESVVKEAFRYIADQKELHQSPGVPWSQLVQLDIKTGEWEPFPETCRARFYMNNAIYSCWRAAGDWPKLNTARLPCKTSSSVSSVDDSWYEETMCSAGLWESPETDMGPSIW